MLLSTKKLDRAAYHGFLSDPAADKMDYSLFLVALRSNATKKRE
jgi:hypothetical protein